MATITSINVKALRYLFEFCKISFIIGPAQFFYQCEKESPHFNGCTPAYLWVFQAHFLPFQKMLFLLWESGLRAIFLLSDERPACGLHLRGRRYKKKPMFLETRGDVCSKNE
jgi:hypothetical protein